jgi:hypothetical protein
MGSALCVAFPPSCPLQPEYVPLITRKNIVVCSVRDREGMARNTPDVDA